MAHHAIKRLGPTGLIAILVALTMSLVGAGTAIAAAGGSSGGKSPVVANSKAGKMKAPVTGKVMDNSGRKVKGSFTPSEFKVNEETGKLDVTGTLKGHIVGKGAPKSFSKEITTEVKDAIGGAPSGGQAVGNCDILNLVLGPLDLNLLGLEVHLDTVVLDIVANPGPGQLLGNLLCAVAGLLDGNGGLGGLLGNLLLQLQGLLNQILGALSLP